MPSLFVNLPEEVIVEMDQARGHKSRSAWLRKMVCDHLQIVYTPPPRVKPNPPAVPVKEIKLSMVRDWHPELEPMFRWLQQGFSYPQTAERCRYKNIPCPSYNKLGEQKCWTTTLVYQWTMLGWKEHLKRALRSVQPSK